MQTAPIFWSFRRCPYAMRARLAIRSSRQKVELREILLKAKPAAFLDSSPKGTVPVLIAADQVVEESREIMIWALTQSDPEGWLNMPEDGHDLIDICDGPFKQALDHTKYAVRFPDLDEADEREKAMGFLRLLDARLVDQPYLFGVRPCLADMAILPFVRQFSNTDRTWFDRQGLRGVTPWLDQFLRSEPFVDIMKKLPPWHPGQDPLYFPWQHESI